MALILAALLTALARETQCIVRRSSISQNLTGQLLLQRTEPAFDEAAGKADSADDFLDDRAVDSVNGSFWDYNEYSAVASADDDDMDTDTTAHVVIPADTRQREAAMAAMRSVIRHASGKVQLYNFVADDEYAPSATVVEGHKVNIVRFSRSETKPFINMAFEKDIVGDLKQDLNYIRFIMADKLPHVNKALYLDADTITTVDVNKWLPKVSFKLPRGKRAAIAGFPRDKAFPHFEPDVLGSITTEGWTHNWEITPQRKTFNAGALVYNLKQWRQEGYAKKIAGLVKLNNEHKWWTTSGSQAPLILFFGDHNFHHLAGDCYVVDLGWDDKVKIPSNLNGHIFHWNGAHKPWLADGWHKDIWKPYTMERSMIAATLAAAAYRPSTRG